MNCANCLESEDDGHDSFVCEECQASSIDDAVEPFKAALLALLKSATPHPVHHPTMWTAWRNAEDLLKIPRKSSYAIQTSDRALEAKLTGREVPQVSVAQGAKR